MSPAKPQGSRAVALLLATGLALGCSSMPRAKAMVARDLELSRTHPASLLVHVEGGGTAQWMVHDEHFQQALVTSLVEARAFSGVVEIGQGEYRLDAVLGDLRQPIGSVNGTTVMTVLWSLSRIDTREVVWQKLVESQGISHNFVAVWRLRGGAEYAARDNIQQALQLLADAPL